MGLFKKYIKRITGCILVLVLVFTVFMISYRASRVEYGHVKYEQFFNEDTDYDVMFFGASHTQNGIYPMQLWKDFGITSYNMGGPNCSLPTSYYMLKMAIKYHKPKIAVLDVILSDKNDIIWDYSLAHHYMDAFPLTEEKIEAVNVLFPDTKAKLEMLFPYYVYHAGWKDIDGEALKKAFSQEHWPTFGAEYESLISSVDAVPEFVSQDSGNDGIETTGHEYIRKFVELCRENDIQPMLMFLPAGVDEAEQRAANEVYRIAGEMAVPYVNLIYEEGLINYFTDYTDGGGHLNPSGARKVTAWIGNYLTSNSEVIDHRNDGKYSVLWNETYGKYRDFISNIMKESADARTALMNLYNNNYYSYIEISPGYDKDSVDQMLLDQLTDEGLAEVNTSDSLQTVKIRIKVTSADTGEEICTLEY